MGEEFIFIHFQMNSNLHTTKTLSTNNFINEIYQRRKETKFTQVLLEHRESEIMCQLIF